MLLEEVAYIRQNPALCKTLVIDTMDWAEALCVESVCAKYQKKGIEDFGYGNGYVYTKEELGRLLNSLQEIIDLGINVVLTAHAQMRKFEQPDELGAYDRWELKLGKKTSSQTAPLVKEWADMVLFANYETIVVTTDNKKNKAQGSRRVMYTEHHACWAGSPRGQTSDLVSAPPLVSCPSNIHRRQGATLHSNVIVSSCAAVSYVPIKHPPSRKVTSTLGEGDKPERGEREARPPPDRTVIINSAETNPDDVCTSCYATGRGLPAAARKLRSGFRRRCTRRGLGSGL